MNRKMHFGAIHIKHHAFYGGESHTHNTVFIYLPRQNFRDFSILLSLRPQQEIHAHNPLHPVMCHM